MLRKTRRDFLKSSLVSAAGVSAVPSLVLGSGQKKKDKMIKAYEVMKHIREVYKSSAENKVIYDLVDPVTNIPYDDSRMKRPVSYGGKDKRVRVIGVAMESTPQALRKAAELNCDLFIAHHPTFGFPNDSFEANSKDPVAIAKKKILDESAMTLIRVHGTWDIVPEIGVFDTWVRLLGYDKCKWEKCVSVPKWEPWINKAVYMKKLRINEVSFGDLAQHVANVVSPYGQNGVLVTGDSKRIIRTLGVGDGGITDAWSYYKSGCDAGIVTNLNEFWWASSLGMNLVYVEHIVSELEGLKNLASYLSKTLPEIRTHYINNGCPFRIIEAK